MSTLPPLRALQIFEIVGRSGGVVEAAKRLGISAGAVSQQMKLLEDALGLHLMQKEGKRLRLTPAGRQFHESCSAAFEGLRAAHAQVERSRNMLNLSISALPSMLSKWLSKRVLEWQAKHPELSVYLDGSHSEPVPEGHEFDFRISYGDRVASMDNAVELFRDSVVPACSPQLLEGRDPIGKPADILEYSLISVDWGPKFVSPPMWRDWFDANHVDSGELDDKRRVFTLASVAIQAAIDGQGFVLAQYSLIRDDLAGGRLVVPLPTGLSLPWPYFLTWKSNTFDRQHCRSFHRWILTHSKEQQQINDCMLRTPD